MVRILIIPAILLALLAGSLVWSGEATSDRADFAFIQRDNITLDPNDMSWGQDIRLAYNLWEGLYTPDPVTCQPIFGAADSVQVSPDQLTYTFHLRDNARWSNGDPVVAQDFAFSWRRMLESNREYSYLHFYIKGAQAYSEAFATYDSADKDHKPPAPDFSSVGEKVLGPHEFQLTLAAPVPFLSALLSFPPFYPMNPASMQAFRQVDPNTGTVSYNPEFTRPPNLISNGKYRVSQWTFHRRLRMVPNDYYWDRASIKCNSIDEIHAEDTVAAFRMYEQGDVDWLENVDGEIAASLIDRHRTDIHIFPAFGTQFFEFNCEPKLPDGRDNPLSDFRVRQALTLSLDKVPIIRDVARLHQPLATTYVPIGAFPNYNSPAGLPYDPPRARKLLADAGYPNGKNFPRLSILFNTDNPIYADMATIARRQWSDQLGIFVDNQGEEISQYRADLHGHKFCIARANWSGDYNDPSTFSDKYLSESENNSAHWKSPEYDKLCAQAAVELNPAKRFALLAQAEGLMLDQAPIAPLYGLVSQYLISPKIHGLQTKPIQIQMMQVYTRDK